MKKFQYGCDIGEYSDDVRVSIDVKIIGGLDKEDYQKLKDAFAVIEETAYKYFPKQISSPPDTKE